MGRGKSEVECVGLTTLRVSGYSRAPSDYEKQVWGDLIRRLRDRRVSIRITQEQLEHELGVGGGLVAKWESFQRLPGAFMMACWCAALGVTLVPVGKE